MATSASATVQRSGLFSPSPFSDQSHVLFYSPSRAKFPRPSSFSATISSSSSCKASMALTEVVDVPKDSIARELAELKLQMKQKKKQLKAVMKQKKKAEKKMKKQRKEMAMAMDDSSSSSSSSESSCDEMEGKCTKATRIMRKGQSVDIRLGFPEQINSQVEASGRSDVCADISVENTVMQSGSSQDLDKNLSLAAMPVSKTLGLTGNDTVDAVSSIEKAFSLSKRLELPEKQLNLGTLNENPVAMVKCSEMPSISEEPVESKALCSGRSASCSSGTISVCVGGKCKRAGSEKLLESLRGQVPSNSSIEAVPHKCFGRCKQAINVRVHKEDTNPQYSSHASAEDADLILKQHFGIGSPASGLPSFNGRSPCQKPVTVVGSSSEPCVASSSS